MQMSTGKLVRELKAQGYSVKVTGGGHLRITHPAMDGPVFAGASASCNRANKNLWATLKRKTRKQ